MVSEPNTQGRISKMAQKWMEERFEQLNQEMEGIRTCAQKVPKIEESLSALMKTVENMSVQVSLLADIKKAQVAGASAIEGSSG